VIAAVVSLAAFMEVLDTNIANVALSYMAGGLAASVDDASWVLTSYLVANAIVLPISGWLSIRFGRKRFYMSCVVIFTVSSFLCGIAPSLGRLILFYRRLRAKPRRPQCARDRLREVRPALSRRRQMERQANHLGEMRQGIDRARTGTIVVHGKPIRSGRRRAATTSISGGAIRMAQAITFTPRSADGASSSSWLPKPTW
jgi:hypothetical protein